MGTESVSNRPSAARGCEAIRLLLFLRHDVVGNMEELGWVHLSQSFNATNAGAHLNMLHNLNPNVKVGVGRSLPSNDYLIGLPILFAGEVLHFIGRKRTQSASSSAGEGRDDGA